MCKISLLLRRETRDYGTMTWDYDNDYEGLLAISN